jgi:CheY-like chemotaxis protein
MDRGLGFPRLAGHAASWVVHRSGIRNLVTASANPVDLVLMDVMMPEMDGYTEMRQIRAERRFAALPIIAVTAKAMKADREKCIQAGASDYIAKPVEVDKLLSLLRVWLSN